MFNQGEEEGEDAGHGDHCPGEVEGVAPRLVRHPEKARDTSFTNSRDEDGGEVRIQSSSLGFWLEIAVRNV